MTNDVLCVILGGGRGTRLFPLTKDRAKPAVPLFGKYRLIDIPISNCLNSGFHKINILTQFNSESLNKHISRTYKFESFSQGFIEIIAADQTMENTDWFQGPADAVRKSLKHFLHPKIRHVCILSGDQVYKMDLRPFYEQHILKKADLTVACNLVAGQEVSSFGILGATLESRVTDFVEKPSKIEAVKSFSVTRDNMEKYLCSMGIYLFTIEALRDILAKSAKADFGKEIIPEAIRENRAVFAHEFNGYWRDIGTIKSFYAENLALTEEHPPLDLFDENWPIYTRSRSLPPAKFIESHIENSIVADGSMLDRARVRNSIIGLRSKVGRHTSIEDSIIMGADYYDATKDIGIGPDCLIRKAILDKNACIGRGVKIVNEKGLKDFEGPNYIIRDGISCIYKNAIIPAGTVI